MKRVCTLVAVVARIGFAAAATPVALDAEWSPAYFWVWNARLDPAKLCAQLEDMAAHGLGSVCVHPWPNGFRPGTMPVDVSPDYLTDEYLAVVRKVFDEGARRGFCQWMYDEGGWPSGGAAGQVAASDRSGAFAPRFLVPDGKGGYAVRIREYNPKVAAAYPSVIERGTTGRFLALTHDRLETVIGHHFGKSVKFVFTDEPAYQREPLDREGRLRKLTWTADFPEAFRARKGYDILPKVGWLFEKPEGPEWTDEKAALRIDYLDVLAQLFAERYLRPIRDWCRPRKLLSGGHFGGEDEPPRQFRHGAGDLMRSLSGLDLPGVDVIWRQLTPGARALPFPRYAASAAHQAGGRHVLSESFGIYGNGVTPDQWKWLVDYQLVRGVNTFVFGYQAVDNSGPWMTRFEPHAGPVRPEWDFLPPFYRYVWERSQALGTGKAVAETAVLYDTRDFWAGTVEAEQAFSNQLAVAEALDRRHVDYDFVTDDDLAGAKLGKDRLAVGKMSYRTLVLPRSKWMSRAAKERVMAFERSGGRVIRGTDVTAVEPTCIVEGEGASDIRVARRLSEKGETLFFVNESSEPRQATLAVGGRRVDWAFAGFGSALFVDGEPWDEPMPALASGRELSDGWTLRKVKSHALGKRDFEIRTIDEAARPAALGDWRGMLGETFSGVVRYRNEFEAKGGPATLDLGKVCWTCRVRLNGQELKPRFFGPFRWAVTLRAGKNVLEVDVANTLANATGDLSARRRVARDFSPVSPYEGRQAAFDRLNHDSGLLGPVRICR